MAIDLGAPPAPYLSFWRERHLCTLTTLRPDGTPHVVPVGVTYDPDTGVARVLASRGSRKVRNVLAAAEGPGPGARVAVCQVDGRRWATLEGLATVTTDPGRIAEGERRYAERYGRQPRVNPDRAVIEIAVDRALGNVRPAPARAREDGPGPARGRVTA
ncbi:TIGR03618 family F420-dependent PPOX class oxidoreductase [Streptomyces sp. CC224B]|uniref:pyridoxamine 5'-phosphate oxidase family protein n=1 Tax=Streptomyces sp. CC224B TaxID=3044571 RepID=UPI0024A8A137|nr:TIGR03618 family F420-dependent PPOX class oxidoreductase [Streptomyces sp. CC224B]